MTERKVLNKYFPPDFDPKKIPRMHMSRDRQYVIRIMAPFSMQCNTCGEYIYKGKKFNARRETSLNETYLGLRIYRFYIRCPRCVSEVAFKTDPEHCDYICEGGATRTFEAQKIADADDKRLEAEREEEEMSNPMKALENRTKESKREMDILDALEEIKDQNARFSKVEYEDLLTRNREFEDIVAKREEEEEEAMVKAVFGTDSTFVRRIQDDSDEEEEAVAGKRTKNSGGNPTDVLAEKTEPAAKKSKMIGVLVKKKAKDPPAAAPPVKNSGLSLLGGYEGSSSSDEND